MVARASFNGIDLSGPLAKIPSRGHNGATWMDETNKRLFFRDDDLGLWLPADGQYFKSTSAPRVQVDLFRSGTINTGWSLNKGADAQTVNFAAVSGDPGYVRGVTGNAGTGTADDAVAIGGAAQFDIADGSIVYAARVRTSSIATVAIFIGLHDTLPASTLEMPFTLSGTTFTSTATDGAGFLIDTAATTDTIRCVAVKNDVDATAVDSADAWAADTWKLFQLKINTSGDVAYYIDGVKIATISSAIRSGVSLLPIVAAVTRTTTVRNVDVSLLGAA